MVERDLPFTPQTRDAPGCRPSSAGDTLFHRPRVIAVGGSVAVITKEKLAAGQVRNLEWRVSLYCGQVRAFSVGTSNFSCVNWDSFRTPRALVVME